MQYPLHERPYHNPKIRLPPRLPRISTVSTRYCPSNVAQSPIFQMMFRYELSAPCYQYSFHLPYQVLFLRILSILFFLEFCSLSVGSTCFITPVPPSTTLHASSPTKSSPKKQMQSKRKLNQFYIFSIQSGLHRNLQLITSVNLGPAAQSRHHIISMILIPFRY